MHRPCGTGGGGPPAVGRDAPTAVAALPEVVEDWGVSTAMSWSRGPREIRRPAVFAPDSSTVTACQASRVGSFLSSLLRRRGGQGRQLGDGAQGASAHHGAHLPQVLGVGCRI